MPKTTILRCAVALFVLVVAWPMTTAEAHCAGNHTGDHPHCGSAVKYDITVGVGESGSTYGSLFQEDPTAVYQGGEGAGRLQTVGAAFQRIDLVLDYFFNRFAQNEDGTDRATSCFGGVDVPLGNTPFTIRQSKDDAGVADASYGFQAYGDDGQTVIGYTLRMLGGFDPPGNWRPTEDSPTTEVILTHWRMITTKHRDKDRRELACEDVEGEFPAGEETVITVKRRP